MEAQAHKKKLKFNIFLMKLVFFQNGNSLKLESTRCAGAC